MDASLELERSTMAVEISIGTVNSLETVEDGMSKRSLEDRRVVDTASSSPSSTSSKSALEEDVKIETRHFITTAMNEEIIWLLYSSIMA